MDKIVKTAEEDIEFDLGEDLFSVDDSNGLTVSATDLDMFVPAETNLTGVEGFTFPAILLQDVFYTDVLKVIKTVKRERSFREMPVWVESSEASEYVNVGEIQLDSDFLLTAKYVGIRVIFYADEDNIIEIDLNNPDEIAKYI